MVMSSKERVRMGWLPSVTALWSTHQLGIQLQHGCRKSLGFDMLSRDLQGLPRTSESAPAQEQHPH